MLKSKTMILFVVVVLGLVFGTSYIETKNASADNTDKSIVNVN